MKTRQFPLWILLVAVVLNLQCTTPSLATEVRCQAETQLMGTWSDGQSRMAGRSETAPPEDIQLLGIGSKSPVLIAKNAKSVLLSIKMDEKTGVYQFFEKAPLGSPILWAYYVRDPSGVKKLSKHQLVRMKSYRQETPVAEMTFFSCE